MAQAPPFGRVLKLGSAGADVKAVKRALARAGFGPKKLAGITPVFGPFAVRNLKAFQKRHGLTADGEYGPASHRKLARHFDDYARLLYARKHAPPKDALQLPEWFEPTHPTGGLPGYPAIDVFAKPGTIVLAPADGWVRKLSGRDPSSGGSPGGSYGYTIYLRRSKGGEYFLTHFGSRKVGLLRRVKRGQPIGTVCDSAVSGKPGTSHIHEGFTLA